jgi:hypothetical protein
MLASRKRLFEVKGSLKAKALRRQRLFGGKGKGPSKVKEKALRSQRQRTLGCKGPWEAKPLGEQGTLKAKGPSKAKAKALRRQRPFEVKA